MPGLSGSLGETCFVGLEWLGQLLTEGGVPAASLPLLLPSAVLPGHAGLLFLDAARRQ